ncbi:MAG: hypothetical protein LBS84_10025 [Clostridiales bacterium]|nr:hypothetical protein [Clostridiales bacterium]
MGIFKPLGEMVFGVAGIAVGGAVSVIGKVTNIGIVKEIGDGIEAGGVKSGAILGQAVDGVFGVAEGVLTVDLQTAERGFHEITDTAKTVVVGAANNFASVASGVAGAVSGLAEGDVPKAKEALQKAVRTSVLTMFTVGTVQQK